MNINANELELKILNPFNTWKNKQNYFNFLMLGVDKKSQIFYYHTLKSQEIF